jgi:hypothetical protein
MRRITLALVGTIAVLVLLFSYRTSTSGAAGRTEGGASPGIVAPAVPGAQPGTGSSAAVGGSGATGGTTTVNGTVVDDGFGPVQVQVKASAGKIVDVTTLALPQDGHSQQINSSAVPQLRQEVLTAQNAHINTVSGATLTSQAYTQSLQAALDAAHLGGS